MSCCRVPRVTETACFAARHPRAHAERPPPAHRGLPRSIGPGGDEAIHGVIDAMSAGLSYETLQWAVPIHPTVSELIPTVLAGMERK